MMSVRFQFLDVYLGATLVGRLSKTGDIVQFLGDESYLENPHRPTLSLSYNSLDEITGDADTREIFTKSGTRWTRSLGAVPAFFENLLHEGALLDWIADQRQVSTHDAFELLAANGSSLPGALVIRPSDIERLGARLERHAAALQEGGRRDVVATPVAAPVEGAFSMAGQQMKLALSMVEKGRRYTLKTHADTGQEIVAKLPSLTRRDSVEVEYAGMRLARLAHVNVPDFWIERTDTLDIGGIEQLCPSDYFLAVARFDRVAGQSPAPQRQIRAAVRLHRRAGSPSRLFAQPVRRCGAVFPSAGGQCDDGKYRRPFEKFFLYLSGWPLSPPFSRIRYGAGDCLSRRWTICAERRG